MRSISFYGAMNSRPSRLLHFNVSGREREKDAKIVRKTRKKQTGVAQELGIGRKEAVK